VTKEDDNEMVFKGFRHNNLYVVDFSSDEVDVKTCLFTKTSLGWLCDRLPIWNRYEGSPIFTIVDQKNKDNLL